MECLLAVVGPQVMTDGIRTGTGTEIWREREREFQILGAATLKMWGPMDVQTNEAESRLVCYNLSQFRKNFGHKFLAVVTSGLALAYFVFKFSCHTSQA